MTSYRAPANYRDATAREFLQRNFPRHLGVMAGLVGEAQRAGDLRPLPLFQAMSFIAGAVAMPIMMATALQEQSFAPLPLAVKPVALRALSSPLRLRVYSA